MEPQNKLESQEAKKAIQIIQTSQLQPVESKILLESFAPFFELVQKVADEAYSLLVTDSNQTDTIAKAREARLVLKRARLDIENKRKLLKEESLRKGKAIDGVANILKYIIEPAEEHLEQQERFLLIQEKRRLDELEAHRKSVLSDYKTDTSFYNLREMTIDVFDKLVESEELSMKRREDEERQAQEKRIADQEAEEKRLKDEADEKKKLQEENRIKDEQLKIEREAREKLESETREKEQAEKAKALRIESERKAEEKRLKDEEKKKAKMSDTDKVKSIVDILKSLRFPEMKSDEAKALVEALEQDILKMVQKINNY